MAICVQFDTFNMISFNPLVTLNGFNLNFTNRKIESKKDGQNHPKIFFRAQLEFKSWSPNSGLSIVFSWHSFLAEHTVDTGYIKAHLNSVLVCLVWCQPSTVT